MRRNDLLRMSYAEVAIHKAIVEIENMAADTRLTNAVVLLMDTQRSVADFIDGIPEAKQSDDNYVAWLAYKRHGEKTTIHTCDADTPGAFKVWRQPK